MKFTRIKLSERSTQRVRTLKGWLGITPNIICRLALAVSLRQQIMPDPEQYDSLGMEINRPSLTGNFDAVLLGLLRQHCNEEEVIDEDETLELLRAHINRGIDSIYHLRTIGDIVGLLPQIKDTN